jgi:hypothetical protein
MNTCWLYGFGQQINILAVNLMTMPAHMLDLPMAGVGAYRRPGSADIYRSYQAGWPQYEATVAFTTFEQKVATGTFHGQ